LFGKEMRYSTYNAIPHNPKSKKHPYETLENTAFPAILHTERAGIRTPDNLIKSQVLYHLSYTPLFNYISLCDRYDIHHREKCPEPESNQRHEDFQSSALPTELSGHLTHNTCVSCGSRI